MMIAMKPLSMLAGCLVVFALAAGCRMLPRYARGDIQSQGFGKIPAGSSFALRRSLAANAFDGPIARRVSDSLREAGYRETSQAEADVLVWYRYSVEALDGPPTVNDSEGFEAIWSAEGEDRQLLSCPSRFDQRLTILATGARAGNRLWQGELCSDGAGRDPVDHAGTFTRELIRSYGKHRAETRFEFRLRPPSAPQPQRAASRAPAAPVIPEPRTSAAPAPGIEPATAPTQSEPATAPQPNVEPQADAPTKAPVTPQLPTAPAEPEYAEAGPTWSSVKQACAGLDSREGVGCALVVIVASGSPVLEVGYASRERAVENWKSDVAEVGAVFCTTATKHGVLDRASVHISAPDQSTHRSCRELAP